MLRMMKTPLAVAVLLSLTLAVGQARAEVYTYSGFLPGSVTPENSFVFLPSADMDGLVSPGDRWTVTLDIDLSVDDGLPDVDSWGAYSGAIKKATVQFQSGYSATFDSNFALNDIDVYNDYDWGFGPLEDGVLASVAQGSIVLYAEVATQIGVADPLSSDALPLSPTTINNNLDYDDLQVFQFADFGGDYWEISYNSRSGETFQAVPEPSTILLWCFAAVGLGFVGWRKRRAA